ncbi:MAG: PD-(D/E)XK nuclease family protein [Bacteroidaceae bacterium]|nr:PD-(D/E)XK nuclease family protein [Bacteroidaceae bacterium]
MKAFLQYVAEDLMQRHDGDMSKVVIVSPNKRVRLFMNEYLLDMAKGAMWAPHYLTIGELYGSIANMTVCDTIPAVRCLYNIYRGLLGDEKVESMDRFWGWGELILQDFDDIDKHLVNAHELFLNARQLGEMEKLDFLTDNQREALQQFFGTFSDNRTTLQKRFMQLWEVMPQLYDGLRKAMPEGIAPYEGAAQRSVVEDMSLLETLPADTEYCFVGFNMLCETDKALMQFLKKRNQAVFYWDYDLMYVQDERFEAGDFIRENLKLFPNRLTDAGMLDNLRERTEFTFVSTSTDSIGTRYIPEWLGGNLTDLERETAIVLCDENQLQGVLHAIPDNKPDALNITMGYSLKGTPVFSLVCALLALQTDGWDVRRKRFRRSFLNSIEYHPFARYMDSAEWMKHVDADDNAALIAWLDRIVMSVAHEGMDLLMAESIYLVHRSLQQFMVMATDKEEPLQLQGITIRRLLRRALSSLSIPFHGEPAEGMQVMGVLETRSLDFRNILMLNVGEGYLPKTGADASLIPNTIRIGYHLTTLRHKVAVFAYYFYRLIQRAESVTFVFNQNSAGMVHHEMSRFLRQLQAETDIRIRTLNLEASQEVSECMVDEVEKSAEIMDRLYGMYDVQRNAEAKPLSPSSINRFMDCPMKFYLQNVCRMRVEEDPEDGIDPLLMGTIFHNTMKDIYDEICSHTGGTNIISKQALTTFIQDDKLRNGFMDKRFKEDAKVTDFRGENILIRNVVERYVVNTLRYDCRQTPFVLKASEEDFDMMLPVRSEDGKREIARVKTGGRVDRLDIVKDADGTDVLRIVDYKTGASKPAPAKMDDLFKDKDHNGYYLQTFLYALSVLDRTGTAMPIRPALLYASQAGAEDYNPVLKMGNAANLQIIDDIRNYRDEFMKNLEVIVRKIFDPALPFVKTDNERVCQYCEFKRLCGRKEKKE